MRSAMPETFPSNVIKRTIRCDTNQQHHMTQHLNLSHDASAKIIKLCKDTCQNYYEMNLSGTRTFEVKCIGLICPSSQFS